jgi:outer membrane protein TolC
MRIPFLISTLPALLAAQEPLTLQDAIASALQEQPRLKAAEEGLRAAEARAAGVALNRLGRLETTYLYTPSQKPLEIQFPGVPPLIPPATFEVKALQKHSFQAAYSQPLWTWGALGKQTSAARLERDATRSGLDRTRQQTAFEAAKAFLTAAQAQEAVAVARQALDQQRAFIKVAKSRFEAGAAPRLDLLKAELAVARAESDLLQTRNKAQLAREALASITYDRRFRDHPLANATLDEAELPSEEGAVARALSQRPDLKSMDHQASAAKLGSQAASASRLPSLAVRGSITQQHDEFSRSFNKSSQLYQAGLAVSWEGFSPLRSKVKSAELLAQSKALEHGMRALEGAVALEVRSALLNAREARERSLVEGRAVLVAEEQARVARLAYQEGVLTSVEAQEAELALTGARFKRIWANLDAAMAHESLRFAMGE